MSAEPVRYRRFDRTDRALHAVLMVSFLGLALTGIPLLNAGEGWASWLANAFGGFRGARLLHRAFAIGLIGTFVVHLARLGHRLIVRRDTSILWGPHSMVPQPRDLFDLIGHVRYFVGLGERPRFDRFTYWEKFDYWAVFWGMAVIGGSGLVLWFPQLFGQILPGWAFNVALIVHGEEALLAVGFIFTIHFFNGHLRPEKFPMDTVIFTGSVTEHELREERPDEWDRLVREGQLEALRVGEPRAATLRAGRALGTVAVCIGLTMVCLIIYTAIYSN